MIRPDLRDLINKHKSIGELNNNSNNNNNNNNNNNDTESWRMENSVNNNN